MFQSLITHELIHEVVGIQTVNNVIAEMCAHCRNIFIFYPSKMYKHLGLQSIWTLSIIQYSKEHNISKTGSSGERVGGTHSVGSTGKS
jgi:hypothetical protein